MEKNSPRVICVRYHEAERTSRGQGETKELIKESSSSPVHNSLAEWAEKEGTVQKRCDIIEKMLVCVDDGDCLLWRLVCDCVKGL